MSSSNEKMFQKTNKKHQIVFVITIAFGNTSKNCSMQMNWNQILDKQLIKMWMFGICLP
jgi:hypothetical protein